MIGQAAVKNVDSRRWQITAGAHDIKSSSRVVSGALNPLYQTVTRQQIVELDCVPVVDSFETYIDVADKRQRLDVRRQTIKKISEFAEEAGGYGGRARAINDGDEKRHRVAGNASRDELERGWLNADVNRRQVKSGTATTATPPWLIPNVSSTRRGLARSTTENPSARSQRMATESLSCHVSHSARTSTERSQDSISRLSSSSGDSERILKLLKTSWQLVALT